MHKQILILFTAVSFLLLPGCAQKLPVSGGQAGGIMAFPMKAELNSGKEFTCYYAIAGKVPQPFEIKIYPMAGRDFIISDILTPGTYEIDTWITYATPTTGVSTSFNKKEDNLQEPVYITVKDGEITMASERLEIVRSSSVQESFSQSFEWIRLNKAEVQTYKNKLKSLENGGLWQIHIESDKPKITT
ncbi:hypothetical protein [Desulfopila sp. IMCC35008]|uniref:hypothetical protein n=1 Tax=Desulfopila sp. IMCC35008 TaxID=2653858 RepID=UPI0013D16FF1|nr:hypothetical protein [Desulfopila sp. IMCC35008]